MNRLARTSTAIVLSSVAALVGCSSSETSPEGDTVSYVRDIQPLLAVKCGGCHTEGGIAPFPLDTYEQVVAMKDAVRYDVSARIMPPWLADDTCADYTANRSLTDAQLETLVGWIDNGSPRGEADEVPAQVEDERTPLSRVDFEIPLPEAYTPQLFPDDYRCFFVDWPATTTLYATGFGVTPGNAAIVHHVISYVVRPENVALFQAIDDADAEPGWPCFGGPGSTGPGQAYWLGAWVPGLTGEDFPEGTGIEIPAGSKVIVQMHYNSDGPSPGADLTKILVRADETVKKKAAILPFADVDWLTKATMTIPAHSSDVVHSVSSDPTTLVPLLTGGALAGGVPLTVYSAGLHLHTLGERGMTRLDHAAGGSECLLDVPRWDFNWQGNYTFREPKQMLPGDKIYLECQWDNPRETEVNWGDGTSDEMCLGLYYLTE